MIPRRQARDHRGRRIRLPRAPLSGRPLLRPASGSAVMGLLILLTPILGFLILNWGEWGAALALVAMLLALGLWAQLATPGPGRVIESALRRGCCPSCGYEIKTAPPASDGCVVCPECGAAWRLAQAGQRTDPEMPPWSGETG